jgi:hypothetical protein
MLPFLSPHFLFSPLSLPVHTHKEDSMLPVITQLDEAHLQAK